MIFVCICMCINTENCINIICTVLYKYILHVPAFLLAGVWSKILYICLHVALFMKCLGNSTLCVPYILYIPAFLSPVLRSQATSWVACVASWDTDGKIDTCDLTDEHAAVWTVWGWRARDVGIQDVGTWTGWSYACISSLDSNFYLGWNFRMSHRWWYPSTVGRGPQRLLLRRCTL